MAILAKGLVFMDEDLMCTDEHVAARLMKQHLYFCLCLWQGEWPSGLYSLRQVTEVKLGRVRSDFRWVPPEA